MTLVLLTVTAASHAEEMSLSTDQPAPFTFSLTGKGSAEAWSGTRTLDDDGPVYFSTLVLQGDVKVGGLTAHIDGFGASRDVVLGGDAPQAVLREAYLSYRTERWRLRVGAQNISWGRTDLINPTDNLPARRFTWLVANESDYKVGPFALSADWSWNDTNLQVVWQPLFRGDEIPLPQVSGLQIVNRAPSTVLDTFALRYDVTNSDLSWSLSYFQGASKRPTLAGRAADVAVGRLTLEHPFERVFGIDLERLTGKWIIRGEAAYHRVDGSGSDPLGSRQSFFLGVLGLERNFGDWSAFVQALYRRTSDYLDANDVPKPLRPVAVGTAIVNDQLRRSLMGVGTGLTYNSPDLSKSASVDLIYFQGIGSWGVRPKISYKFTDRILGELGGDFFAGPQQGPLGRLRENRLAFIRIEYALTASN